MIPHSRPRFGEAALATAGRVIASGQTASGPQARSLETEVAGRLQRRHAVAVDSGTSALMLAIRALAGRHSIRRIGIPAYGCGSLLHAVRATGCTPVCMDCNDALRLDGEAARGLTPTLDAVVLVHPFGMVEPLVAESWPCPVIEDIAQAPGARLSGRPVGAFGDLAICSFYATKPWGGAYGGMVLGDDEPLLEAVGEMSDPDRAPLDLAYAGHHQLSDMHAALALSRLQSAEQEMAQRRRRATQMDAWFAELAAEPVANLHDSNDYRYIMRAAGTAAACVAAMREHGVEAARPVSRPLHHATGDACPQAEAAWRDCVSLPLLADAGEDEMQRIREALQACL